MTDVQRIDRILGKVQSTTSCPNTQHPADHIKADWVKLQCAYNDLPTANVTAFADGQRPSTANSCMAGGLGQVCFMQAKLCKN